MSRIDLTGITVAEPFQLKDHHADYGLKGIVGPTQKMAVNYNAACTDRQAALGLMTMIAK